MESSTVIKHFGVIDSGIHRSSPHPVDNLTERVSTCGQPKPKFRSPQGSQVNRRPANRPVPGEVPHSLTLRDTLRIRPMTERVP